MTNNVIFLMRRIHPTSFATILAALLLSAAAQAATTHVWSGAGGDSLFSNVANWSSGGVPAPGATVILRFPPAGTTQAVVNIPNLFAEEISITRTQFTLAGIGNANPLIVKDVNATNNVQVTFAESLPITLSNVVCTFSAWSNATVRLNSRLQGTSVILRFSSWGQHVIGGTQANTFTGLVEVAASTKVHMNKPIGVNAFAGDVVVKQGARLYWDAHQQLPDTGTTLEVRVNDDDDNASLSIAHSETMGTLRLFWTGGPRSLGESEAFFLGFGNLSVGRLEVVDFGELYGQSLTLRGPMTITNGFSDVYSLSLMMPLQLVGNVTVEADCDVSFNGEISGAANASLRLRGVPGLFSSIFEMLGTNTYAGMTYVDKGEMQVHAATDLGLTSSGTVVGPDAYLRLAEAITLAEPLTFLGQTNDYHDFFFGTPTGVWMPYSTPTLATLSGPIYVSNNVGFVCGEAGSRLTISGAISGPGTVFKSREGALRFTGSASNSFSGGFHAEDGLTELQRTLNTQVLPGPVVIHSFGTVRSLGSHQIADKATVQIVGGLLDLTTYSDTIANLEFTGGTATAAGGAFSVLSNIVAHAGAAPGVMNGTFGIGFNGLQIQVEGGGSDPGLQINSTISGGILSSLNKWGDGRLELGGANTYAGTTYISDGVVTMKAPAALGTSGSATFVSDGAVLEIATTSNISGEFLFLQNATLRLLSPSTNIWGGGLDLTGFARVDTAFNAGRLLLTNSIVGVGDLVKVGPGTLEIGGSATNNYLGYTYAGGGTLVLNKLNGSALTGEGVIVGLNADTFTATAAILHSARAAQVADFTPVGLTSLGTWNLNGFNDTIGSIQGYGTVNLGAATLTVGGSGASSSFEGLMTGNGSTSLVKVGAGTFTMTGVQTYTGRTTVSGGTLLVNGTNGPGLTTVSGGTLGGRGQIGNVTAQGGIISPGNSPGILKIGNLIGGANLTYRCELNSTNAGTGHDQLSVTGSVNLGQSPLQLVLGNAGAVSNRYTIVVNDSTDAITSTFSGLSEGATFYASGTPFRITYTGGTGNDVVLTQLGLQQKPQIGSVKKLPNGNIEINGTGIPDLLYSVYASTNVAAASTNWLDLGLIQATPAGALQFVDTDATNFVKRFYQFVLPPYNQ